MTIRNAICLVVDGLRASALGAYGNTWYATPALDQLAVRSLVADWLWVDSPEVEQFYRGVWHRVSAFHSVVPSESVPLPKILANSEIEQSLITDNLWLDDYAPKLVDDNSYFDSHWLDNGATSAARAIEDTAMGRLFASVIEQLDVWSSANEKMATTSDRTAGKMLWVHSCGMHGPWDAPYALREALVDEDEPAPSTFVTPPQQVTSSQGKNDDPDQWLGIRTAYAAQTVVLDACIGAMVDALEETGLAENTLLMLVGSRGFSLGEHGSAGTECRRLFSEQLHVPWLVLLPDTTGPVARFQELSQPADIGATLLDWFGIQSTASDVSDGRSILPASKIIMSDWRQFIVAQGADGQQAIRTPAWMLRQPGANDTELYSKPDDRWEFNDIAVRCPQIVEELTKVLADFADS